MNKFQIPLIAAVTILFAGCSSTPEFQSGPEAEVTHDGLTRLDKTIMDAVWARTDISASEYSKIMLVGVGVEYRPVKGANSGRRGSSIISRSSQSNFQLDDKTKALVEQEIREAFVDELAKSDRFEIADEAGPDVLTVVVGLLDVVSLVPPETVGRSSVYLDRVGEATLVLELRDSMSNAILARAVDRRAAQQPGRTMVKSSIVTSRTEVRRLGHKWGSIIRDGLEKLMSPE